MGFSRRARAAASVVALALTISGVGLIPHDQAAKAAAPELTDPIENFVGQNGGNPPDTVGDVGPNHYVQMVNSTISVYDKQGNQLGMLGNPPGVQNINALWAALPAGQQTECRNSSAGDPIVLYDQEADRWMASQFTDGDLATTGLQGFPALGGAFPMCIAYSQTPDPTGNWFPYQFNLAESHDYMKYAIWPDGLYMTTFEGNEIGVYVFERAQMLSGSPARFIDVADIPAGNGVDNRGNRSLPADWDGTNAPPAGAPAMLLTSYDDDFDDTDANAATNNDRLELRTVTTNWTTGTATLSAPVTLTTAPFSTQLNCTAGGGSSRDCIEQPGTANRLDALANRLMHRLQYRAFSDHESMVVSQTVDADNDRAGVRWYELRRSGGGAWAIYQQGTYAPQDGVERWMSSAAMDSKGDISIGYSVSDGNTTLPGIRYTGRRFDDPLGSMPQGEHVIPVVGAAALAGAVNNPNDSRWGDYSAMSVDPVDDCTFWYTQMFIGAAQARSTQIASFAFPSCAGSDLRVVKTDSPDPVMAGEELFYTVTVTNDGPNTARNVVVTDDLPDEVIYLSDSAGCTYDIALHRLTCQLGDIPSEESRSFTIKTLVRSDTVVDEADGTLLIRNTVSVTSDSLDTNATNNSFTTPTFVQDRADLQVTKVCKPDGELLAGETGTCTVYVDNLGPSSARDVVLRDANLSDGSFTFGTITPSQGTCGVANGVVTCQLGDLAAASPSASGRATVTIEVSATERVDINDVADVNSATQDPDPSNNQARGSINVTAVADLSIDKTGPTGAVAGTTFGYVLTIHNDGPSTAGGVVVEDVLSAGVEILSVVGSDGASCNAGVPGNPLLPTRCSFGTLAPGATRTMTIQIRVLPGTLGPIHNDARVTSQTFDDDLSDNLDTTATEAVGQADLSIVKTDSPDPVVAGQPLTYTVAVANAGPSTAHDVKITDTLPAGTSFVSGVDGNGATVCALVQTGTVVCDLGDMAPGQSATVYLTVLVAPSVPDGTVLSNTATVTSTTADPNATNNSDTETTDVDTSAELWLDKTGVKRSGNPSPMLVYTLTVHNDQGCETDAQSSPEPTCGQGGPSDAQNVVVTDKLPLDPKKVVVQFVSPQCTYTKATHTVTCRAATVPAGATVKFVIEAQVSGSVGTVTNTATMTSGTFDPVSSNNTDSATVVVKGGTGKTR